MNTLELDQHLNTMVIQGKSVDAFVKLYAKDVVSQMEERQGAPQKVLSQMTL